MGNLTSSLVNFGGVRIDLTQVAKKYTLACENNKTKYVVIFKDGVKAAYEGGNGKGSLSSSKYTYDKGIYENCDPQKRSTVINTNADNIKNLEIVGTKKYDNINVKDSSIIDIDAVDGAYDKISIVNSKGSLGESVFSKHYTGFGDLYTDKKDQVTIENSKNVFKRKP